MVRAGLLGEVQEVAGGFQGSWAAKAGLVKGGVHATHALAVAEVARFATGGLRFHDLRHSYACSRTLAVKT